MTVETMGSDRFPPVGAGNHPDDDLISLYIDDRCSVRQRRAMDDHLAVCQPCRDRLAELFAVVALLDERGGAPPGRSFRLGAQHRAGRPRGAHPKPAARPARPDGTDSDRTT